MITLNTEAIDGIEGLSSQEKTVLKSQLNAQFVSEQLQFNKEFSRYKQDCRKRALEMAHIELTGSSTRGFPNNAIDENSKLTVQELADKYYNWLISIPNDK